MQVIDRARTLQLRALVPVLTLATGLAAQEHPGSYTAKQLRHDFAVFRDAMEEAHPGLYVFREAATMAAVLDREAATLRDGGSEWTLYRAVTRVISEMQDGHTRASLSEAAQDFLDTSPAFLPFAVHTVGEKAFLVRDYTGGELDLPGSEIVSIDGRAWAEVEGVMLDHLSSDGASRPGERRQLENALTFGRLYQILFGPNDHHSLELNHGGAHRIVELPALTRAQIETNESVRYGDPNDIPRFELSFPDTPEATAVLRIGGFYGGGYRDFIEDAFRRVQGNGARRLVIDVRDNGGGVESYGQQLVAHLSRESFDFYDRAVVNHRRFPSLRLSNSANRYYSEEDAIPTKDGRFELTESYYEFLGETAPLEPYFGGDVYVLADGGSFSTTTDTMTRLHQMGRAVFVGTEAGGSYYGNTSGGTATLTLPHSKLRVRIPLERFYNNATGDEPAARGLIPDYTVEPSARDRLEGRDPALEKVFELIRATDL